MASYVQGVGEKSNSYKFWDIRNRQKKWTDDSEYLCMRNPFNKVLGWIFKTIPVLTLGNLLRYTGIYLCISSIFEKAHGFMSHSDYIQPTQSSVIKASPYTKGNGRKTSCLCIGKFL